jgi:hypothetical protein
VVVVTRDYREFLIMRARMSMRAEHLTHSQIECWTLGERSIDDSDILKVMIHVGHA